MSTKPFPWGSIIRTHHIEGLPPIIEYKVGPEWEDRDSIEYQLETKSFGTVSYKTFDHALMAALCDKYDNHETSAFVWRILKVDVDHT